MEEASFGQSPQRAGQPTGGHLEPGGQELLARRLAASSARWRVALSPGVHALRIEGLEGAGLACIVAAPKDSTSVWREFTSYTVEPGGSLSFEVERSTPHVGWVVLQVATQGVGQPWSLRTKLDGGHPALRSGESYRRTTSPEVSLSGRSGDSGIGRLWELGLERAGGALWPDGWSRARFLLGDDLAPGAHRLTVENTGSSPLWIRAILVGEATSPATATLRVRRLEEP